MKEAASEQEQEHEETQNSIPVIVFDIRRIARIQLLCSICILDT